MNFEDSHNIPENRGEDGMNITERKLFNALKLIGLNPLTQYDVGQCKLDFAFPEYRWAFEVYGPYHYTEEGKKRDRKRMQFLHHTYPPWRVKGFNAERVFKNPDSVARAIKKTLEKSPEGGADLGGWQKPFNSW